METKLKIEIFLTGVAVFFLLGLLVIMPFDIMDFYGDKETYARVYHLNTNERNWEWQYLDRWVYFGLLIFTGLTVITLRFVKKDHRKIRKVNWIFLLFFFGSIIIGIYNWMKTGFDHCSDGANKYIKICYNALAF